MDKETFSKLVSALREWKSTPSDNMAIPNQPIFTTAPMNTTDFANRTLSPVIKIETINSCDVNNAILGNTSAMNNFQINMMLPPDHEQVPMDDYDPLETFNFLDTDTFYYNQEDLEANCGMSPNMPEESEMAELQDYLIHEDAPRDDMNQIRNPTLAELNSCGDTLFDCSADNSFLSEDSGYLLSPELMSKSVPINECGNFMNHPESAMLMPNSGLFVNNANLPLVSFPEQKNSQSLLSSSCPVTSRTFTYPQFVNPHCDEKFLLCPQNSPSSDSFMPKRDVFGIKKQLLLPGPSKSTYSSSKRLRPSSSLPVSSPMEVMKVTHSLAMKAESPSSSYGSKCTEKSLSRLADLSISNDDESGSYFDSDRDDDDDDGFSSDEDLYQNDDDETYSTSWPPVKDVKGQSRRNRYFWQYNLQSRGMKSQNLLPLSEEGDPYVLNDVKDPVFSEGCTLPVKHSGKARKGDGNDLTPNPRKLYTIGLELKKLSRLISNLNPAQDFSVHGKPLSRKEKNKLASRVCRLKKKAQHEANKIKLYGLQHEHKHLISILSDVKTFLTYKVEHFEEMKNIPCFPKIENHLTTHDPKKVAGNTTNFVNDVLDKVANGDPDGGMGNL